MILFIGEILADRIDDGNDTRLYLGGAPYNAAVACAMHGGDAVFLGRVGDDETGDFLIKETKKYPLKSIIQVDKERSTTIAQVSIDNNGERDFRFLRDNTADYFIDIDGAFEAKPDIVHFGSLMLGKEEGIDLARRIIAEAKKSGALISFDVNFRSDIFRDEKEAKEVYLEFIRQADVLKISHDEALLLFNENYEKVLPKLNNKVVCVTLGKDGSMVKCGEVIVKSSTEKVTPIDTTGAGDAFFGTFLAGLDKAKANGLDAAKWADVLKQANEAGKEATLHYGALPQI